MCLAQLTSKKCHNQMLLLRTGPGTTQCRGLSACLIRSCLKADGIPGWLLVCGRYLWTVTSTASLLQALQEDNVKVMTINPAQVSSPMTWSRPDAEYIPDLMIQPKEVADLCLAAFKVCLPKAMHAGW